MKQLLIILAIVGSSITFTIFGSEFHNLQKKEEQRRQEAARAMQQAQWSNNKIDSYTMQKLDSTKRREAQQYNQNNSGQKR